MKNSEGGKFVSKGAKIDQKGSKSFINVPSKKIKGVVNWLENDKKARKEVTKVEMSKGQKESKIRKKGPKSAKRGIR